MARKIVTSVIDDIDGSEGAETIHFAIHGVEYNIDLSETNRTALEQALTPYIEAGTRSRRGSRRTPRPTETGSRTDLRKIREWARRNGHEVSDRGRIPTAIIEQYDNQ